MSLRSRQAFQDLLRIRRPMAPEPAESPMPIRSADELIDEATRRLADLDRRLARLQQLRPETAVSVKIARAERDLARIDLLEIIELAEMPIDYMGWASPVNTGKEQGRTWLAPTARQPAGAGSQAIGRDPAIHRVAQAASRMKVRKVPIERRGFRRRRRY